MDDKSMSAQAPAPSQPADEAQTTSNQGRHHSGGNAMLDAEVKASNQMRNDTALEQPSATDIAGNTDTDDPTDAKAFRTTGAYPVDSERLKKDYTTPSIKANQGGTANIDNQEGDLNTNFRDEEIPHSPTSL